MSEAVTWIRKHRAWSATVALCAVLLISWLFCLPRDLFKGTEYSSVVLAKDGSLLGARIAADGQWRFPECDSIPDKYSAALIEFEDRHFRWHPGVDPLAMCRAVSQNIRAHRIVSGGSTITMQVIRMSRSKERTLWQKVVEAVLATRLELRCSKDEILSLYASHAPFGGNVVGLPAASWRYYGRSPEELSWGEASLLAVLPNSPSNIHPGRNRTQLLEKRNRLLKHLYEKGFMNDSDYELALEEPLPGEPLPLPSHASHYVDMCCMENPGRTVTTSIDLSLQKRVQATVDSWSREFSLSGIGDLAAVVIDVHTGEVVAWCGNADVERQRPGVQVDAARAPRSTGSILKPFLYCASLQDGVILPNTLLQDTPVNINGFSPQNFDMQYDGAVPASRALARSLNVPFVRLLKDFGVPKFHELLKAAGMTTLKRPSADYGLSIILGGAEGRLDEITSIYASMAAFYQGEDCRVKDFPFHDRTAVWYTFDALKEVNRPDEMDWRMVSSVRKVAWKTGTSYGFRDGWAVGVTPDYAVGVWAGNAMGQGVPGLVGGRTAGPVMFDLFNLLPASGWFKDPPYGEYVMAEVCRRSGHLKGMYCDVCDTIPLPEAALRTDPCPYHRIVNLTSDRRFRVESPDIDSTPETMFLLPAAMEWYYRQHHTGYEPLPPLKPGTVRNGSLVPMEFIYPENGSVITIPRQMDGTMKGVTFNLAHSNPGETVYWHMDSSYIGETCDIHQMTVIPDKGKHTMTVVDREGASLSVSFTIKD